CALPIYRTCEVDVLGRRARTFRVGGHHYALVLVEDLEPGSATPYEVRLDGGRVWQPRQSAFPPSRIRTAWSRTGRRSALRPCRFAAPGTVDAGDGIPPDALDCYADRVARLPEERW